MCYGGGFAALGLIIAATVGVGGLASATVRIEPPNPTVADSIRVVATSTDWQGVWTAVEGRCEGIAGDTLVVTTVVTYCNGNNWCLPTNLVRRFNTICTFGPLLAGDYVVQFTELHFSNDPLPTTVDLLPFTVSTPTPAARRTWGSLKSVYR